MRGLFKIFPQDFAEYESSQLKQFSEIVYPSTFLCSSHLSCLFGWQILWTDGYFSLSACTVLCTQSCQSWQWPPGTVLLDMPVN